MKESMTPETDKTPMRYPILGPDGDTFDQCITSATADPFYDPCPAWCEQGPHTFGSCAEDRYHYGERIGVPLELEDAELELGEDDEELRFVMPTAQMYLTRSVREREAQIWLGKGELGNGFNLTLNEAEKIAGVLLSLVAQGRSNVQVPNAEAAS